MKSWLKQLKQLFGANDRRPAPRDRRKPSVRLCLEALEIRLVPSATVQFTSGGESVNEGAGTFSIPVTLTGALPFLTSTFASGFNEPDGLAFDAAGNLYVANAGTGTVDKVTPAGVVSTFASGFNDPFGLAFDAAGNLYVANFGVDTVSEVTPAGVVSTFASGFNEPVGLAFDAAGNLYVANFGVGTVSEVTPAGMVSAFASGFSDPQSMAFDAHGNLYVANGNAGTVSEVTPAGVVSTFDSGFSGPVGLAFDVHGNLYVANFNADTVSEVSTAVTVPFTLGGTATAGVDYSGVTASPLVFAPDKPLQTSPARSSTTANSTRSTAR